MAKYESLDNQKKTLNKMWDKTFDNKSEIDNNIKRFEVRFNSKTFLKTIVTIPLQTKLILLDTADTDIVNFDITFIGFPDWVLPYTKVFAKFYTEEGYDVTNDSTIQFDNGRFEHSYWWKELEGGSFLLKYRLDGRLQQTQEFPKPIMTIPLFVDLSLVISNRRIYQSRQHYKTL